MDEATAYLTLYNELRNALLNDATRIVQTPAFLTTSQRALDVIDDCFAGRQGDAVLAELLAIVAQAARGNDVSQRALQWIEARCREHAAYHRDDYLAASAPHPADTPDYSTASEYDRDRAFWARWNRDAT